MFSIKRECCGKILIALKYTLSSLRSLGYSAVPFFPLFCKIMRIYNLFAFGGPAWDKYLSVTLRNFFLYEHFNLLCNSFALGLVWGCLQFCLLCSLPPGPRHTEQREPGGS